MFQATSNMQRPIISMQSDKPLQLGYAKHLALLPGRMTEPAAHDHLLHLRRYYSTIILTAWSPTALLSE